MMGEALAYDSDGWPVLLTSAGRPSSCSPLPPTRSPDVSSIPQPVSFVAAPSSHGPIATKDHPDSPRKIDAAVAALVAYDRAMWHAANTPERVPLIAFT